jgi:hypothetical protein
MKILNLSVPKLKFIFSTVFILLLLYGKAHGSFASSLQYSILKNKAEPSALVKNINSDKDDGDDSTVRKRKARGVEVPFPEIPDLSFGPAFVYRDLLFLTADHSYCSFRQYVPGKRGPPSV